MNLSPLSQGNLALRNKDYVAAIRHYMRAMAVYPELGAMLQNNVALACRRGDIEPPATGSAPAKTFPRCRWW